MNRIIRLFISLAVAASLLSCTKEEFAGKDIYYELGIEIKGFLSEESQILRFRSCHLYIEGYDPGESFFGATVDWQSDEHPFLDYFLLDFRFRDINSVRDGRKLHLTYFDFANPLVNGGSGFTSEYSGSVYLVERTEKEAVLFFDQLKCNILNTDFTFDGCVHCPLKDKIPSAPL